MNRPRHTATSVDTPAAHRFRAGWILILILAFLFANAAHRQTAVAQGEKAAGGKAPLKAAEEGFNPGQFQPEGFNPPPAPDADTDQAPPKGFRPRSEIAPSFNIKEEWIFNPYANDRAERMAKAQYDSMKLKGVVASEADQKILQDRVRFKLAQFTLKDARDLKPPTKNGVKPAFKVRDEILVDVSQAFNNSQAPQGNPIFHRQLLETIVKETPKLFKYHFMARLNAAILLTELNLKERDPIKGQPEVPYYPAATPLLQLLEPPKPGAKPEDLQPEAVKIWAVNGLVRIGEMPETGDLNAQVRHSIVEALIRELESTGKEDYTTSKDHWWYQMRLAQGLGLVNYSRDRAQRATIPQALLQVLVDKKRHPLVRAEAAQALGRIQYDNKVNASLIATAIAEFATEVGKADKNPPSPEWEPIIKLLAVKLYASFNPVNKEERARGFGLLNSNKMNKGGGAAPADNAVVKNAYLQILPLVNALLNDNHAAAETIVSRIEAWLKVNPPKDQRVSPEMPPLARQQARRPSPDGPAEG